MERKEPARLGAIGHLKALGWPQATAYRLTEVVRVSGWVGRQEGP